MDLCRYPVSIQVTGGCKVRPSVTFHAQLWSNVVQIISDEGDSVWVSTVCLTIAKVQETASESGPGLEIIATMEPRQHLSTCWPMPRPSWPMTAMKRTEPVKRARMRRSGRRTLWFRTWPAVFWSRAHEFKRELVWRLIHNYTLTSLPFKTINSDTCIIYNTAIIIWTLIVSYRSIYYYIDVYSQQHIKYRTCMHFR